VTPTPLLVVVAALTHLAQVVQLQPADLRVIHAGLHPPVLLVLRELLVLLTLGG